MHRTAKTTRSGRRHETDHRTMRNSLDIDGRPGGQQFQRLVDVEVRVDVLQRGPRVVVVAFADGVEGGLAAVAPAEEVQAGRGGGQGEQEMGMRWWSIAGVTLGWAILPAVVGHRLHGNADAVKGSFDPAQELIAGVPIP